MYNTLNYWRGRKLIEEWHWRSAIQWFRGAPGLIIPHMRAAIVQSKSFAHVCPSDWTLPAPAITRLSLSPIWPHGWLKTVLIENRIFNIINLKNLICVDIVKFQVKFCLLLDFLHIIGLFFLKKLASTGGPREISRRAAGWTALSYTMALKIQILH